MNKLSFSAVAKAGGKAIGAAVIINSILFFAFKAMGLFPEHIEIQPGQPLSIVPVLFSSIVPLIFATLIFYALERFTQRGFQIFSILAIILLVLSFANPFLGIQNVTVSYAIALDVLHLPAALAPLYFFKQLNDQKTPADVGQ